MEVLFNIVYTIDHKILIFLIFSYVSIKANK